MRPGACVGIGFGAGQGVVSQAVVSVSLIFVVGFVGFVYQ